MGKLTKGFLLGAASVLGAYYYKNPEEAKKHKELVLENAKKLLDKVNNVTETQDENEELTAVAEEAVEVAEVEENGIKLQAKEEAGIEVPGEVEENEELDSLLSAFEPQEEETVELDEISKEEKSSKAGLVAGAGVLGGVAVAGTLLASDKDEVEAEESSVTEEVAEELPSAETKVEEVKEEAVELKDSAVEKATDLKDQAEAKKEEVEESALDLKDASLEKSQELSEEAKSESKVSTGLLAGAAALGGAAVAGVAGSKAEAQEANEELAARVEETQELATAKVEEVKEQAVELKDSAVEKTEELALEEELVVEAEELALEEELVVEEYTTEDEDELARLDREIAELEAQIRAEQGDSEILHSFDLSDANVTEADLVEETPEFTYEEAEITPEEELVEEVTPEEESNSIFGKIKSLVSGEKDAQSTVEEVSSLKDDVTNLSVEDLKAELGESTGLVPGSLEEVKGQVEDKVTGVKDEVLSRANLQADETVLDSLKSEDEDLELNATEEVEEKKGFFGKLGSLFTSKK
ncbi:MAG: hypothetical protein Q3988_06460 [Gemella sp.]|nr:hypothetical protein [Gemella sp.]